MDCLFCQYGEGEKEHHKFCPECVEAYSVDVYSQPLNNLAYHILMAWEIVCKLKLAETVTEEERELVSRSVKWEELKQALEKP